MKYIKKFEMNTLQRTQDLQDKELAGLKFTGIISEIFKNKYNIKTKSIEESTPFEVIKAYSLRYAGNIICKFFITKKFIEIVFYNTQKSDFDNFIEQFFNFKDLTYKHKYSSELNNYSDKIKDEFDLFMNSKKYNL